MAKTEVIKKRAKYIFYYVCVMIIVFFTAYGVHVVKDLLSR